MIFNSFVYILFLIFVVFLYWFLPRRQRFVLLFSSSIVFYGFWRFDFVILLLISVTVDYLAALVIDRNSSSLQRRLALYCSLGINLGLLAFFKYYYFLADNANGLGQMLGVDLSLPTLSVLLPIGISFYTFQSISYTIDVYRGFLKPSRDYLLFANYVMFFPQLIAGPILRANEVIWQLDKRPAFHLDHISLGIRRILLGLFLKVVLADNISPLVDEGFAAPLASLSALDILTLAYLFGFQIYFDFAAYSHIAIGSAQLMGIHFPENFNQPYIANSPRDFWKRWHISLSSWIRDYLYLPLAGAKVEDRSTGGLQVATGGGGGIPCDQQDTDVCGVISHLGHHGIMARGRLGFCSLGTMARKFRDSLSTDCSPSHQTAVACAQYWRLDANYSSGHAGLDPLSQSIH